MTGAKYIDAKDLAEIRAIISAMLAAGRMRTDIVAELATRFVPHDDLAKLVARVPTREDAARYQLVRVTLFVLMLPCLIVNVGLIVLMIMATLAGWKTPGVITSMNGVLMGGAIVLATCYAMGLLRRNDGMTYSTGFLLGIMYACNFLYVIGDSKVLTIIGIVFATIGVAISVLSWIIWRKFFPDMRLINAPPRNAAGMYEFKADKKTGNA